VIGGQDQQQWIRMRPAGGSVGNCRHRRNRNCRCRVAADRLEQDRLRLRAALEQLLRDQKAMTLVAHHERCADIGNAGEPRERFLQHRALADERQQLFGVELARHRPQARARAAGKDDWNQHRLSPRPIA
jgi:hypothetical protein